MEEVRDHKQILREELSRRMAANPLYSQRAFARDLKLSPQYLSNVLIGRKGLSHSTALKICKQLGMNKNEQDYFCNLIQSQFARSEMGKKVAEIKLAALIEENEKTSNLTVDSFRVISDWYHFAMIELIKIAGTKSKDTAWIAKQLGIPAAEAKMAISRLMRLELIAKTKSGYKVNQDTVLTTDGVASDALKKFHKQVLEKAAAAVTLQTVDERYVSSSFMPVEAKDLPQAKKLIQKFREQFIKLNSKPTGENVYSLSIQFFNLTKTGEENEAK